MILCTKQVVTVNILVFLSVFMVTHIMKLSCVVLIHLSSQLLLLRLKLNDYCLALKDTQLDTSEDTSCNFHLPIYRIYLSLLNLFPLS